MNYKELASKIEKTENNSVYINPEHFSCHDYDYERWNKQTTLTRYYVMKWLCTDTWVGATFVFHNDKPVAYTWQSARKDDEEWLYFSIEDKRKIYEYIHTFANVPNNDDDIIDIETNVFDSSHTQLNELGYKITYRDQILIKDAYYEEDGKYTSIKIIGKNHNLPYKDWHNVDIEYPDGKQETVKLDRIVFPWGA